MDLGQNYGGASRARTDDLIVANDALSQLSYSPIVIVEGSAILAAPQRKANPIALPDCGKASPLNVKFVFTSHAFSRLIANIGWRILHVHLSKCGDLFASGQDADHFAGAARPASGLAPVQSAAISCAVFGRRGRAGRSNHSDLLAEQPVRPRPRRRNARSQQITPAGSRAEKAPVE